MRDAAIFDVDGTLVDVSSVRHYVSPSDPKFPGKKLWEEFHGKSIDCPPIPQALQLHAEARADGLAILIVTARMNVWSLPTLLWLKEHGVEHDELYMRKNQDYRKDYIVKAEILQQIKKDGYRPVMAVDDNPNVIKLWQDHGIPTHIIPGWEN